MIKNGILILILFSIALSGLAPHTAHAIPVGVVATVDLIPTTLTYLTDLASFLYDKAWNNFLEFVLKVAIEEFKLKVLNIMNQQVVSWITKGESGAPKFITNWETYLVGSFQVGFNSVGGELRAAPICNQFKGALINSNWQNANYAADQNSQFVNQMGCTLDPLLGQLGSSPQAFQNDFRNGGWLAYSEQLLKPQNTYIRSYFMATDEAISRGQSKQNASQQQGLASKGYLPVKRCVSDLGPDQAGPPNPATCGQFQITSPASVFESAINAGIKGRFDYIVNADQMVQLVTILAESFANNLIKSGIDGLFGYGGGGGGTPSAGFINHNINQANCGSFDANGNPLSTPDPNSPLCKSINNANNVPISIQPNGAACTKNTDCASLICGPAGKCIDQQSNGAACNSNIQCVSALCGPSNTCINPLLNGSNCNADGQCRSGFCSPTSHTCNNDPSSGTGGGGSGCTPGSIGCSCLPGNICTVGSCNFGICSVG